MTAVILWYVVVGAIALALTPVYISQKKPLVEKSPRWHEEFDEPV